MRFELLQLKRALHTALFVLLLSVVGMTKMYAYDFSAVCPSGQTLYYKITDSVNLYVEIVLPNSDTVSGDLGGDPLCYSPYWAHNWLDETWNVPEPIGNVVLPEMVDYNNETYTLTSIGGEAFLNCTELVSITIPNSVTAIEYRAFYGCSSLTSIALSDSLVSISWSAFVRCTSLESIEIPNAVTSIGDYAFSLSGIKSIVIPSSVTTIGEELFADCGGLTSVTLPSTVTFIDDHAFVGCGSLNELIVFAETPPALGGSVFYDFNACHFVLNESISVYVPCGYEDAYASLSWGGLNNFYGMCGGTVTVAADPEEGGTVTGGGAFEAGQICTVTATANANYTFVNWTENGEEVSAEAVYSFAVADNRDLVANFAEVHVYDFSAICPSGQTLYYNIIDSVNHYVELACPCTESSAWGGTPIGDFYYPYWILNSMGGTWNDPQPTGDVVLPETVEYNNETYTLTSIGNDAFINCTELTSVTIPNSVTTIGSGAFYECSSMTSVMLPDSLVSIGSSAFVRCTSLESVEIPNTVTSIGDYAFSVSGIKQLEIPSSVTTIGEELFAACGSLISVTLPSTVTFIDDHAFWCGSMNELIVFAETPPALGVGVFYVSDGFLKVSQTMHVYVPCGYEDAYASLSWGGLSNFYGMCGGTVTVAADPEEGGTVTGGGAFEAGQICTVTATANENYTFVNWTENGEEVSTEAVYSFAVADNRDLVANFSEVHVYDFSAICPSGQTLYYKITDSVNHYVEIVLPNFDAFGGDIGGDPIYDCYSPYWTRHWLERTWNVPEPIGNVVLPEMVDYNNETYTLTSIGTEAFVNCIELVSVTIPNSVTTIGHEAFYGCSSLTSIVLSDSLVSIGWSAFVGCTSLESIEIPNSVTSIGKYAFSLSGITSIVIPNAVTVIGEELFADCGGLTSVTLPSTVTFIDYHAFVGCGSLNELMIFAETPAALGGSVFYDSNACNYISNDSISVYVPCGTLSAYQNAAGWNQFTNIQELCSQQTITLFEGTNWFSTYLDISLEDLKAALVNALGTGDEVSITIKSQTQNVKFRNGRWIGQLSALDMARMYTITVNEGCEIVLEGTLVDASALSVTISAGVNWIAFPFDQSMTPADFFGTFPVNDDVIKSQIGNTRYVNGRWVGQLTTLKPGKGYIYDSADAEDRIFTFPTSAR